MSGYEPKPHLRDPADHRIHATPHTARPADAWPLQRPPDAAIMAARHSAATQDPGWSQTFPATPDRISEARSFLAAILQGCALADDAILCLSELASNAVTHSRSRNAGGQFTVRVILWRGCVHIEVRDGGGPWTPQPDSDPAGGRGLLIVSQLAHRWGRSGDSQAGWTVWFDIDVTETADRNLEEGP